MKKLVAWSSPPKKNPDALGGTIPLSIGQRSLLRSQKYAFFLYRQIFQILFSTGSTKKQPPKKRTPSQERRQKGADIYIIVRAREQLKRPQTKKMRRCFFPRAKRLFRPKCWRLVGNKGYKGKRRVSKKTEAPIAQAETRTENRPNLKPKSPKNGARIFSFSGEIFSTPEPK